MSIRVQILIPMSLVVAGAISIALFASFMSGRDNEHVASVTGKIVVAGELSRKANAEFDRLDDLVAEVLAMTHFVAPAEVEKRFGGGATRIEADLEGLNGAALSPQMGEVSRAAIEQFKRWRTDAEAVVGLRRAPAIVAPDVLKLGGETLRGDLDRLLTLSASDAHARIAEIGAGAVWGTRLMLSVAVAVGLIGAAISFWQSGNIARPLRELVAGAEKLARGDVSIAFAAAHRRDEIGDIARAVAAFRDNVTAAQGAQAAAASERQASETERRRNEASRASETQEQSRIVQALSEGLERLAHGDLTWRIETDFSPVYAKLKTDFNKSLDALQRALGAISAGARDLQAESSEIAGLANDISARTGSQTASIEEAVDSLEEITSTLKSTADNAAQAREVVSRTREEAERSGAVVRTAVAAIGRIRQSSQEIEKIIGVIDEIAFQTNLLALNAGVEAARAGETGRGFAVVATEVRALAQRSANASKEIKGLISTSSAQVKEGVDLVVSAGAALDRIFAQVSEIDGVVGAIAGGAAEQATAMNNVNKGVAAIDRVNQSNVDRVERTTAACASVASRADELVEAVAKFEIEGKARLRRAA